MSVAREVIVDLLPLYASGEASPATRELVEAWLRDDPELAREARSLAEAPLARPATAPSTDVELQSLRRTRSLLTRLRWSCAMALAMTALSLSTTITFRDGHLLSVRPLILDYPWAFGTLLVLGIVGWVVYFSLRRKLRYTAL